MIASPLLVLGSLASAVSAASLQVVTVGKGGSLSFSPDTITAAVGSEIEFQFYGPTHSVVEGTFDTPCIAANGGKGFFAGMTTNGNGPNPTAFTITINDTKPIYFYCGFPGHCEAGMVGVINPSSSNKSETLDIFRSNAANVGKSTTPAQQQGGKFGPFVDASSGSSSSASSGAPSSTQTGTSGGSSSSPTKSGASAAASTTHSAAGRVSGEIALVGALAAAIAAFLA